MKRITVKNNFHNTEANVVLRWGTNKISGSTVRRIAKELCGLSGCKCGGVMGERGPQDFTFDYNIDENFNVTELWFNV